MRRREMPQFQHFVMTRFNLRHMTADGVKPAWLEHRFELFERFCYPSVLSQTDATLQWLILFDVSTPPHFRERFRALSPPPWIHAHFIDGFNIEAIRAAISEHLDDSTDWLITTTLDNDDALAKTFVSTIQSAFARQSFEFLNVTRGYRLVYRTGRLYEISYPSNSFISLVESRTAFRSIMGCYPHYDIPRLFKSPIDIRTEPLWLVVSHAINVDSWHTWGQRRVAVRMMQERFSVDWHAPKESGHSVWRENLIRQPMLTRWILSLAPHQVKRCLKDYWREHRRRLWFARHP